MTKGKDRGESQQTLLLHPNKEYSPTTMQKKNLHEHITDNKLDTQITTLALSILNLTLRIP